MNSSIYGSRSIIPNNYYFTFDAVYQTRSDAIANQGDILIGRCVLVMNTRTVLLRVVSGYITVAKLDNTGRFIYSEGISADSSFNIDDPSSSGQTPQGIGTYLLDFNIVSKKYDVDTETYISLKADDWENEQLKSKNDLITTGTWPIIKGNVQKVYLPDNHFVLEFFANTITSLEEFQESSTNTYTNNGGVELSFDNNTNNVFSDLFIQNGNLMFSATKPSMSITVGGDGKANGTNSMIYLNQATILCSQILRNFSYSRADNSVTGLNHFDKTFIRNGVITYTLLKTTDDYDNYKEKYNKIYQFDLSVGGFIEVPGDENVYSAINKPGYIINTDTDPSDDDTTYYVYDEDSKEYQIANLEQTIGNVTTRVFEQGKTYYIKQGEQGGNNYRYFKREIVWGDWQDTSEQYTGYLGDLDPYSEGNGLKNLETKTSLYPYSIEKNPFLIEYKSIDGRDGTKSSAQDHKLISLKGLSDKGHLEVQNSNLPVVVKLKAISEIDYYKIVIQNSSNSWLHYTFQGNRLTSTSDQSISISDQSKSSEWIKWTLDNGIYTCSFNNILQLGIEFRIISNTETSYNSQADQRTINNGIIEITNIKPYYIENSNNNNTTDSITLVEAINKIDKILGSNTRLLKLDSESNDTASRVNNITNGSLSKNLSDDYRYYYLPESNIIDAIVHHDADIGFIERFKGANGNTYNFHFERSQYRTRTNGFEEVPIYTNIKAKWYINSLSGAIRLIDNMIGGYRRLGRSSTVNGHYGISWEVTGSGANYKLTQDSIKKLDKDYYTMNDNTGTYTLFTEDELLDDTQYYEQISDPDKRPYNISETNIIDAIVHHDADIGEIETQLDELGESYNLQFVKGENEKDLHLQNTNRAKIYSLTDAIQKIDRVLGSQQRLSHTSGTVNNTQGDGLGQTITGSGANYKITTDTSKKPDRTYYIRDNQGNYIEFQETDFLNDGTQYYEKTIAPDVRPYNITETNVIDAIVHHDADIGLIGSQLSSDNGSYNLRFIDNRANNLELETTHRAEIHSLTDAIQKIDRILGSQGKLGENSVTVDSYHSDYASNLRYKVTGIKRDGGGNHLKDNRLYKIAETNIIDTLVEHAADIGELELLNSGNTFNLEYNENSEEELTDDISTTDLSGIHSIVSAIRKIDNVLGSQHRLNKIKESYVNIPGQNDGKANTVTGSGAPKENENNELDFNKAKDQRPYKIEESNIVDAIVKMAADIGTELNTETDLNNIAYINTDDYSIGDSTTEGSARSLADAIAILDHWLGNIRSFKNDANGANFNDVDSVQAAINKLNSLLGIISSIHHSTNGTNNILKNNNLVDSLNELDTLLGAISSLSETNNINQNSLVEAINQLNDNIIGDKSKITSLNNVSNSQSLVQMISALDSALGDVDYQEFDNKKGLASVVKEIYDKYIDYAKYINNLAENMNFTQMQVTALTAQLSGLTGGADTTQLTWKQLPN